MSRRICGKALFLIIIMCMVKGSAAVAGEDVSLDVQVVYASSERVFVDPTLVSLKKKLSRLFNYSSFEIVSNITRRAVKGETVEFVIPGGRVMKIALLETGKVRARLNVQIFEKNRGFLSTVLRMERGSLVMVGGPSYHKGVLIIVISAR